MINQNTHKSITKVFLLTVGALLVCAQTTFAIGASPLRMEYQATPGETVKGQLTVYNTSDTTQRIIVNKSDFDVDANHDGVQFLNSAEQDPELYKDYEHGLQQWLVLPQEDIVVEAKQKAVVPYEITVPKDAPAQGYYGALFVRSEPVIDETPDTGGIGMRLTTQVAHLVLLDVEGGVQDVALQDFVLETEKEEEGQLFDIVVYNDGNLHSSPEGVIDIIDSRGNIVNEVPVNEGQHNILPQKTKTFFAEGYVDDLPTGTYYAVLDGKAENGQQIQGLITFEVDRQGKVNLLSKELGAVDVTSLRGSAQSQFVYFQTTLAVLAVFIFAVAFLAIGRYCVVSSSSFTRKNGRSRTKTTKGRKKALKCFLERSFFKKK